MKTILVDALNTFVIKNQGIFQEMYELLETYSNSKIVLTNATDEQVKVSGLDTIPYPLFTLKHHPEKTDPAYFQLMFQELHLSVEDVIYFEHNRDVVKSAESLGIVTYHYDPDSKDLSALKIFLDTHLN